MEPMNATALWTAGRCEVWTPTQNGEAALAAAAAGAGPAAGAVRGLQDAPGRRLRARGAVHDWVRQAVLIAKELPARR